MEQARKSQREVIVLFFKLVISSNYYKSRKLVSGQSTIRFGGELISLLVIICDDDFFLGLYNLSLLYETSEGVLMIDLLIYNWLLLTPDE